MEVYERANDHLYGRYYAYFKSAKIGQDGMLISDSGRGDTPAAAIASYGKRISGKTLVFNATETNRKEIKAPKIITKT